MTFETFLALAALAVATLFTPGPNNTMLATSGANFGFCRTVPHLLGVALGFPAMLLIVGLALGGFFQSSAVFRDGLRYGGALLLLWIAWKVAISGGIGTKSGAAQPMGFGGAAAFQWVNPKGWSMAVAATSQFIHSGNALMAAIIVAATFMVLGLVSASVWALAGRAIAQWLTTARRLRAFNLAMASLIVLSTIQLLAH